MIIIFQSRQRSMDDSLRLGTPGSAAHPEAAMHHEDRHCDRELNGRQLRIDTTFALSLKVT
jgi:hypothetical protein